MSDITVLSTPIETTSVVSTPEQITVIQSFAGGVIYAGGESPYLSIVAGGAISGHRAIAIVGSAGVYADASTLAHAYLVQGISVGAVASGGNISVANRQKVIEPSWSWVAGDPIYLGYDGHLTQLAPLPPTAKFLLQIGAALAPTEADINVGIPIFY